MSEVKPWRALARETLADCHIFEVERVRAVSPVDGSEHDRYRLRAPDWVQIVPVTDDEQIVMVRQYRHGSESIVLEIPAGMVDPGESPAAAARRECLEETGYAADGVRLLGALNPNPAFLGNRLHAFVAEGITPGGEIQNSATEQTEVVLVPKTELRGLLLEQKIDHALVAATLWRFLHYYG